MDRRETERLLHAIRDVRAQGERAAIATVVRVTGSAYRREGTRMLVRENRTYECALSGGCLEPAVAEAAVRVMATGIPAVIAYNLAEDSVFGLGIGCSGAVDIRIERLDDDPVTAAWWRALDAGEAAVLATPFAGAGGRAFISRSGLVIGEIDNRNVHDAVIARARERLTKEDPPSRSERFDGAEVFFDISVLPPELVIFGAGHDAVPLATLGWTLGLAVTVVDVREAFLTPARFPHATLVAAHVSRFGDLVPVSSRSFLVVMNHHLERDRETLRFALSTSARYIGLLGPLSRYQRLLGGLAAERLRPGAIEPGAGEEPDRACSRSRDSLVLLIDGSRSMETSTARALRMAVAFCSVTLRTEVFTFSTSLVRVTAAVRRAASGRPARLEHLAGAWGGGTRIGSCLGEFLRRWGPRLLTPDTVVIIASDGLDVGQTEILRDAMMELRRRSAGVVWVNPLLETAGYEPTATGMRVARPFVSSFASVTDPAGLTRLSRQVRVRTS